MENNIILSMQGICKAFPGVRALQDVNFTLRHGEIHALMGENGAGKSTLIKVLTGVYEMDEGEILLGGHPVTIHSPQQAQAMGISTVYSRNHAVPQPHGGRKLVYRPRATACRLYRLEDDEPQIRRIA